MDQVQNSGNCKAVNCTWIKRNVNTVFSDIGFWTDFGIIDCKRANVQISHYSNTSTVLSAHYAWNPFDFTVICVLFWTLLRRRIKFGSYDSQFYWGVH